ncbi:Cysteine_synthase [Hexamita inflata]|uniref:Cysteine synthase n=1 Tax=Hexamita inflata TaxID=28002 RepID=A0AA86V645_9EUKA|nr:Cysteine synthase [Hexamita inflata]
MLTTAPEIVKQVKQYNLDPKYFITGLGSVGTLVGMSRIFKKELPEMKIVGFEPEQSKVYAGFPRGPHKIQGIAPGFIPQVFEKELCDELVACDQDEAYAMQKTGQRRRNIGWNQLSCCRSGSFEICRKAQLRCYCYCGLFR